MERALNGYIRALRLAGVDASTAEAIDAARALALVGYGSRAHLKAAFGVVLAKTADEKQIHDRVFDTYFGLPEGRLAPGAGVPAAGEATGDAQIDALVQLAAGAGSGGSGGDGGAAQAAAARAATEAGADDIRFASQVGYYTTRTLERLGIAPLEARIGERIVDASPEAQAEAQRLMAARDQLQRLARAAVEQRYERFGRAQTEQFLTEVAMQRSLGAIGTADLPRMKIAVARMAKRLATRHSRRRRLTQHGHLDIRRTLRASAGTDGVPFDLVLKTKRRDKPRIVAVCDISGSVSAYARFLLLFLYALKQSVADLRTFVFSADLHDVAAPLARLPFEEAMAQILKAHGTGSTDYGRALSDLHAAHWDAIDRNTTVLMLGDGRSNNGDPRLDIFRELADRAKRIVWLCTEPEGRWGTGDSCMLRYRPYCAHVAHVATITDLERAVDEVLEAY